LAAAVAMTALAGASRHWVSATAAALATLALVISIWEPAELITTRNRPTSNRKEQHEQPGT
jgi:hypothetical protein